MHSPASASAPLSQTRKSQDDVPMSTSSGFARSTSSTSTAREEDIDALRRKRSKELGSPSDKQYRRAGMAGVGAVGAGAGVAGILAHHGKTTPAGWRDVSVDGKHQIWSSHLSGPRKSALKVRRIHVVRAGGEGSESLMSRKSCSSSALSPSGYGSVCRYSGVRHTPSYLTSLISTSILSLSIMTPRRTSTRP